LCNRVFPARDFPAPSFKYAVLYQEKNVRLNLAII